MRSGLWLQLSRVRPPSFTPFVSISYCAASNTQYNRGMKAMGKKGKHDSSVDTFRENLIAVMEVKGVTISELSRRAKVQRSGLSRFIHGEFGCALEYAYKLAQAVETPLSELVDGSKVSAE